MIYIKNADAEKLADIRKVCEEFLTNKIMNQMYVQFDLDPLNLI